jgi:hypothetical protein
MLAYWLPATTHTLPVNATHRVGVGAFVMNDKREVLAVQEKSGVLLGLGVWKFPNGDVEPILILSGRRYKLRSCKRSKRRDWGNY